MKLLSRFPLMAMVLAGFLPVPLSASECAPFRRGDASDDGKVDVTDAIALLDYLFLGVSNDLTCLKAADTDDSGEVDISDPVDILQVLFLGEVYIPNPGPYDCGVDPTPDTLGCKRYRSCADVPEAELKDFSGFERFDYLVVPNCDLCIPPHGIARAAIARQPDGRYLLKMTVAGENDAKVELPERSLSGPEAERMQAVFRAVLVRREAPHECAFVGIPAFFEHFTWDLDTAGGNMCFPPSLEYCNRLEILDSLAALRARKN